MRTSTRRWNLKDNMKLIRASGFDFDEKNHGSHIIMQTASGAVFHLWPTTDRWMREGINKSEKGIEQLLKSLHGE